MTVSAKTLIQQHFNRRRILCWISIILPLIVLILAGRVVYGWLIHSLPLVQIIPNVSPMQFNTSLLFLLCSFSLLALQKRYIMLYQSLGLITVAIALLTLVQYPLNIDLFIDTLFIQPFTTVHSNHIGRMAATTACSFITLCFSLLLFPKKEQISQRRSLLISLLVSISFALSAVSLIGYLTGTEYDHSWGPQPRMSIIGAFCFILLSLSTMSCLWQRSEKENKWLLLPIFISLLTIVISVSAVLYTKEIITINQKLNNINYVPSAYWMLVSVGILITCLVTLCIDLAIKSHEQTKALSESRELYRRIIEGIEDYAIFMLTAEGTIKSWNKGAQRINQYSKEEVIGRHFSLFYTAEDRENGLPDKILETALILGSYKGEGIRIRKDDSRFWASVLVEPLYDDNKNLLGFIKIDHDITKKIEQQAALKSSEESFRSAMEYAPIGMALISLARKWIKVNPAVCSIVGYSEAELLATDYRAVTHPEDVYNDAANITHLLNKQIKSYQVEKRYLHKNGQIILASVHVSLAWNSHGTAKYFIVQLQDITARRQLEEALKNQAELLQLAHDAIIVRNINKQITFWNKGAETTYGWSTQEAKSRGSQEIPQTSFPKALDAIYAELHKKNQWQGELVHRTKDGRTIVVASRWALQRDKDGTPIGTLEINRDITEQKKIEMDLQEREKTLVRINKKLTESEKFQHLITESIPDMIFVKDEEGTIVDSNTSFLNIYPEHLRDKVIGYTGLESYSSAEIDHFYKKDKEAFATGNSETIETIRYPDGRIRTLHTHKIRFFNDLGEVFIMGIARDITEREELIQKLLESNTELERFAYVASHDLQEPIRMITNFSRIVANDYKETLAKEAMDYLHIIEEAGMRMHAIIQDLLEYSRINNQAEHFVFFDGAKILASTLENIKILIDEKHAQITYDNLPQLYGNPVQIMRVLQNLIINSIKYQPNGNIPQIHIGIAEQDNVWCISVKDNGLGIEQEFLKKIFEPFHRLHTWNSIKGTGIGLSICKKIIENHHGILWVVSSPNEGSTFFFTLPKTPN